MSQDRRVREGHRITEFLNDDVVGACLGKLERKYYEQFVAADSSEARVRAWACAVVLRDFHQHLQSVVTDGQLAAHEIVEIARREQLRKHGTPLPRE